MVDKTVTMAAKRLQTGYVCAHLLQYPCAQKRNVRASTKTKNEKLRDTSLEYLNTRKTRRFVPRFHKKTTPKALRIVVGSYNSHTINRQHN